MTAEKNQRLKGNSGWVMFGGERIEYNDEELSIVDVRSEVGEDSMDGEKRKDHLGTEFEIY